MCRLARHAMANAASVVAPMVEPSIASKTTGGVSAACACIGCSLSIDAIDARSTFETECLRRASDSNSGKSYGTSAATMDNDGDTLRELPIRRQAEASSTMDARVEYRGEVVA